MLEDGFECESEPLQFDPGQTARVSARPDSRLKETFIGIDVPHSRQEGLVKQRGLDWQAPAAEEIGERVSVNRQGLRSRRNECLTMAQVAKLESAKTARVYEAQFTPARQAQSGVGMVGEVGIWSGYEQPAGHAKMDDPLRVGLLGLRRTRGLSVASAPPRDMHFVMHGRSEFADDMLAYSMYCEQHTSFQAFGLSCRGCLEWFAVTTEPCMHDAVAAHSFVHATGDGFHLR